MDELKSKIRQYFKNNEEFWEARSRAQEFLLSFCVISFSLHASSMFVGLCPMRHEAFEEKINKVETNAAKLSSKKFVREFSIVIF